MGKRRPDVEVFLVTKNRGEDGKRKYAQIGAGWRMFDDGTINIILNPGTFLDWRMNEDYYISIRPAYSSNHTQPTNPEPKPSVQVIPNDDDIPF